MANQDSKLNNRPKRRRRRNLTTFIISGIIVVLLVLLLIWIIHMLSSGSTTDMIENLGITVESENGDIGELTVDSALDTQFTAYQSGIAMLTGDEFRIYSSNESQTYYKQISMSDPVLETGGDVNLIYDRGGTSYIIVDDSKETLNNSTSLPIISGDVNNTGWCSIICRESGYRSKIMVYNTNQVEVYDAFLSSSYAITTAVNDDGSYLSVGAVSESNGEYKSTIVLYSTSEASEIQTIELTDQTILDMKFFTNGYLAVVTDESLQIYEPDTDGKLSVIEETNYSGQYLRSYSISGNNYITAIISKYKIGGQGKLVIMNGTSSEPSPVTTEEQILSMSSSGNYTAILTSNKLYVYNANLKLVKTDTELSDVRSILMRSDGSVLLISTNSVQVYK